MDKVIRFYDNVLNILKENYITTTLVGKINVFELSYDIKVSYKKIKAIQIGIGKSFNRNTKIYIYVLLYKS